MNRLFTFGCSYTSFNWSTWADILGNGAVEFQNWGRTGAGNHYIFNSIYECNQRNRFVPGDTVIVCWTNIMREDRYTDDWICLGNAFTQPLYDPDFLKISMTERGCLIRDLPMIAAARLLLDSTKVTWRFVNMVPIDQSDQYQKGRNENQDVLTLYQDTVDCILPSYWEVLKKRKPIAADLHPTPAEHLKYLDTVLPEFFVSESTRLQIAQEETIIRAPGYQLSPYIIPKIVRA